MSRSARTVFAFGLYMLGQGGVLMLAPALLLGNIGVPIPTDAWVRVVGFCLFVLAVYYIQAARHELRPFFGWSGVVRIVQFAFFASLWVSGLIRPILVAFSAFELASGVWTLHALRRERASVT